MLFSSLFLDERLTQFQWLGVVFRLISVYLVNQREQIAAWFAGFSAAAEAVEDAIDAAVEDAIAPALTSPAIAKQTEVGLPPPALD